MKPFLIFLILFLSPLIIMGHGTETHKKETSNKEVKVTEEAVIIENNAQIDNMDAIGQMKNTSSMHIDKFALEYEKFVKVIFEKKCFDCHGTIAEKDMPWYYNIPGVKQMMDRDIRVAKSHLDMTDGFPFGGHGDPNSDLQSIKKSIEEDTMPLFRYRLLHPDSKLTESERKIVLNWIKHAQ